jgi:hypothetical protein
MIYIGNHIRVKGSRVKMGSNMGQMTLRVKGSTPLYIKGV